MQTYTALGLVNEMLQKMGHSATTTVTSGRGAMALGFINDAIDAILNDQEWDFAKRHDGVIYTMPLVQAALVPPLATAWVSSNTTFDFAAGVNGDLLLQLINSPDLLELYWSQTYDVNKPAPAPWIHIDAPDLGANSYKVWNVWNDQQVAPTPGYQIRIGPSSGAGIAGENWEGSSFLNATVFYKTFAHEYVMPDHVRALTAVSVHGDNIDLTVVSDEQSTPSLFPDPAGIISDNLSAVYAGGSTFRYQGDGSLDWGTVQERQLRVVLFPTPETKYKIDYSYIYRFQDLTTETATLRITPSAKRLLVQRAYFDQETTQVGNNPELGERGLRRTAGEAMTARQQANPAKRARYAPGEFGGASHGGPANPRWAQQQPPAPDTY